ncbi:MAG: hypothetical protein M3Y59_11030 [Myxococcota bacterium]|nr:hypothetical protein [Myxococcota bacterium]
MSTAPFQLTLFDGSRKEPAAAPRNAVRTLAERRQLLEQANALAFRLSRELALSVRLSVTDNRSTMVSFRRASNGLRLRLHHMFLEAPEHVVQAIADYAGRGKRHAGDVLDDFIRGRQPLIRQHRHDGEGELDPRGQCFDLQEIFQTLNARFFQDGIQARIGWGRMPGKRRRKSIRLGVYDHQTREIRIHPSMDRSDVPRFFVEFIVFHEMLHQLFPSPASLGRRVHHPRAFRDRERAFPLYEAAIRWEQQNLRLLLRG